jgi:GDP-4-dehydro-6-deoxy-D-mannose reductase
MHKIAVIGAAGFVGRHLANLLIAQGKQVAGVALDPPPTGMSCADWLACDLTQDAGGLADFLGRFRPDALIHLAATSFEPLAASQPGRVLQNNLLTALTVLSACRCLPDQVVCIVVSSSAVYGRHGQDDAPLNEIQALNPLTTYGVSKLAVEALALQQWRAFGTRAIIVRPFNLTGPGEHAAFVTSAFARQIALIEAGRQPPVITVGDLGTARDFTDVRDAVAALSALTERGQPGEVYNLCSGIGVTISDLLSKLLRATPITIDVQVDPALMRFVEIQKQRGDPTKLRQATGWQPRYMLDQTLADVLDDWRVRVEKQEA